MKKQRATIVMLFLAAILFESCADHGTEIMPPKPQPLVLTVEPDSGRIGSIVAIRGGQFKALGIQYAIDFPGADSRLVADSCAESTVFTFVPFGARSAPLAVFSDQLLGLTGEFHVTESPDMLALTVQRYDISPPINAKDSLVVDRMGILRTWRADRQGDTIHISRGFSTGEDYFEYHIVLVDQRATQLPRLVALWVFTKPDYPGSRTDSIHVGILKLQEYNLGGTIAGKFFGRPSASRILNGTFTFWANLRR